MSTKKVYVNELGGMINQSLSDYFLVKKIEKNFKGDNCWMDLILADKTGEVRGRIWKDYLDDEFLSYENMIVMVEGKIAVYQGNIQYIITNLVLKADNLTYDAFVPCYPYIEQAMKELYLIMDQVQKPHLKRLLEYLFETECFKKKFRYCQGGTVIHHTYMGGLLVHTLAVMKAALGIIDIHKSLYGKNIDRDIVITAVMAHDVGKIREYEPFPKNKRTVKGILIGHVNLSYGMIYSAIQDLRKEGVEFPCEDEAKLLHCILASHGEYSQIAGACKEAILVSRCDSIDSMMNAIDTAIEKDLEGDENFTRFDKYLEMQIYKK